MIYYSTKQGKIYALLKWGKIVCRKQFNFFLFIRLRRTNFHLPNCL